MAVGKKNSKNKKYMHSGSLWILSSAKISPVSKCILPLAPHDLPWLHSFISKKMLEARERVIDSIFFFCFVFLIHLSASKDIISFWKWKKVQRTFSDTFSSQVKKTQCKKRQFLSKVTNELKRKGVERQVLMGSSLFDSVRQLSLLSGYYESCVLLRRKLSLNAQILHIHFIVT